MAQPQAADPFAWVPARDVDTDDPTVQEYRNAINWMRGVDLDRAGQGQRFRGVPLTSETAGWRRINFLSAGRPAVSVLIDEVDSYLVAIRRGDGTWLSFSDRYTPLPEGVEPTSMGLESSYTKLNTQIDRDELVFGTPILSHIYHVLFNFNPRLGLKNKKMKVQRKVLVQLIVLFCEAIRFNHLRQKLLEIMEDKGESHKLPAHVWLWVQKWSAFSKFALISKSKEATGNMEDAENDVLEVQDYGINNRDDIAAFLGLILRSAW